MGVCCLLLCFLVLCFFVIAVIYMVNKVEYVKRPRAVGVDVVSGGLTCAATTSVNVVLTLLYGDNEDDVSDQAAVTATRRPTAVCACVCVCV